MEVVIVLLLLAGYCHGRCLNETFTVVPRPTLPIRIVADTWPSYWVSQAAIDLLLVEVLGYRVQFVPICSEPDCTLGMLGESMIADLHIEFWAYGSIASFSDVAVKGTVLGMGQTGFTGKESINIPKYMSDSFPDDHLDVGVLYGSSSQISRHFDRSGSTPANRTTALPYVPQWCIAATSPPNCIYSTVDAVYTNVVFNESCVITAYDPNCFELLVDSTYNAYSTWQSAPPWAQLTPATVPTDIYMIILTERINITIVPIGIGALEPTIEAKMDAGLPVLFYHWTPSTMSTTLYPTTHVQFRDYNPRACYTTGTDYPTSTINKYASVRIFHDPAYADAIQLIRQWRPTASDIQQMIGALDTTLTGDELQRGINESACNWVRQARQKWMQWIQITAPEAPPPPHSLGCVLPATFTGIMILSGIASAILLTIQLALYRYRTHPAIMGSSHVLCQIIISGSYFGFGGIATLSSNEVWSCSLTPTLLCVSFDMIFGTLMAKTTRIYRIFDNKKMVLFTISNMDLCKVVIGFITFDLAVIAVWVITDHPVMIYVTSQTSLQDVMICSSVAIDFVAATLVLPKCFIALYGCYLSYKCRSFPENYNESAYITVSLYNMAIVLACIIPTYTFLTDHVDTRYLLTATGLFAPLFLSQLIFFLPKFKPILFPQSSTVTPVTGTGSAGRMTTLPTVTPSRSALQAFAAFIDMYKPLQKPKYERMFKFKMMLKLKTISPARSTKTVSGVRRA